ncbi:type II toxin-antitoxin system Phd/YefM family antitoxin [Candidatus Poribacteria bacterium]|nr:type II toxin-antitoxin system Phd/YefM family antitoxin [Candidatus Poribacteria bacterium]
MKVANIAEVKAHLSKYIEHCQHEPVVITKHGRMKAVLLPVTDEEDLERLLLSHHPTFREILAESEHSLREEGGIPHDQFWRLVDEDAKVRKQNSSQGLGAQNRFC